MNDPQDFEPKARGVCQTCGTTVETAYGMGAYAMGQGASILNFRVTMSCINCGGEIVMADLQTMHRDDVTVIGTSRAAADDLLGLVEYLRSGSLTPGEAADRIEQRAPWLAPLAMWLRENNAYAGWLSVVISLIGVFVPLMTDADSPEPPSMTEIEETLQEILELMQSSTMPVPPGTSSPAAVPPVAPTSPPTSSESDSPPSAGPRP